MRTMTVDVDIDPWDVIEEIDEEELVDYLQKSGYSVQKEPEALSVLDREDLDCLLERISDSDWQGRRVYDKLKKLRFG